MENFRGLEYEFSIFGLNQSRTTAPEQETLLNDSDETNHRLHVENERPPELSRLLSCPTEICLPIISLLNQSDKNAFAKCSKECYLLTFQFRFRGVRISDLDGTGKFTEYMGQFDEGSWMAPLRRGIRSAEITSWDISQLHLMVLATARFQNITNLVIDVVRIHSLERDVYISTFVLLRTLPYYGNLERLSFKFDSEGAMRRGMKSQIYPNLVPGNTAAGPSNGEYKSVLPSPEGVTLAGVQEFMGTISDDEFIKITTEEISFEFPERLEHLEFHLNHHRIHPYLFGLTNCKTVTTLTLSAEGAFCPYTNPYSWKSTLRLPAIKTLHLCYPDGVQENPLSAFHSQFPNLDSLTLLVHGRNALTLYDILLNFPTLTYLDVPWPSTKGEDPFILRRISSLGHELDGCFMHECGLSLRKVKFSGTKYEDKLGRRVGTPVAATCTIHPDCGYTQGGEMWRRKLRWGAGLSPSSTMA
ncbi:hypothetical protein TWF281_004756 [Arthrobotrys megalospora]